MRLVRSSMLEVMDSEFVKLARIKGLSEGVVIWKHCLRNALIPVLTLWGVFVGNLITGAIITETVFAWPGIGRLTYEAVIYRDFPLLQAIIILKAMLILTINLVGGYSLRLRRSTHPVGMMPTVIARIAATKQSPMGVRTIMRLLRRAAPRNDRCRDRIDAQRALDPDRLIPSWSAWRCSRRCSRRIRRSIRRCATS